MVNLKLIKLTNKLFKALVDRDYKLAEALNKQITNVLNEYNKEK